RRRVHVMQRIRRIGNAPGKKRLTSLSYEKSPGLTGCSCSTMLEGKFRAPNQAKGTPFCNSLMETNDATPTLLRSVFALPRDPGPRRGVVGFSRADATGDVLGKCVAVKVECHEQHCLVGPGPRRRLVVAHYLGRPRIRNLGRSRR